MTISFHTNGRFSKAEDKVLDIVFIGISEYSCCCERLDLISTDKSFAISFVLYPSKHIILLNNAQQLAKGQGQIRAY